MGGESADGYEGADGFAPRDGAEGVEEIRAPGEEPDQEKSPEEIEGDGVVVAGDAEVEVAKEVFIDEVEPEPAVDVAVGGEWNLPMMVGEGEIAGMALGGVGASDKDVPWGGDQKEDDDAGDWGKLADAGEDCAYVATS